MAHQFEKKWRSQDVQLKENVDFSALLLDNSVLSGLTKAGFKKPSPIQLEAIPIGRFGKDLLVQAKSGTGKTLVFTIVALEMLKRKLHRPQVLILTPTREIATQICSVVKSVGSSFPQLTCNSFIGGLSVSEDKQKSSTSQIVVGTPGRIKQLISENALPTKFIRLLVFDEADKLLEDKFKLEIEQIFNSLPEDKQVIATSATYPNKLANCLMHFLKEPYKACLNSEELALLAIVHYGMLVKYSPMPVQLYRNKLEALERVLKTIKFAQCLLFCNGIHKVEVLYRDIKKWGFSATYISSAKDQSERLKAIDRLKNFKCKVLVSSDLTARGIDAENVDLVINFDLSFGIETYLHRVGRAGRYGSIGVAVTIVDENEVNYLKSKEKQGSFRVYKLPDPVPRNLIQKPILGEYFIEDSEPLKECSEETDLSDNANSECNNKKTKKIKPTSKKTLSESNHVSTEQNAERIPEDNITLPKDGDENSSVNCDTNATVDFKNISFKTVDLETICVSNETAVTEHFGDSSEIDGSVIKVVDLCDNEETCKYKPFECSDVITKDNVQISSKLTEATKLGENLNEVAVGMDLMNHPINEGTLEMTENLSNVIRAYTDAYEANGDSELAASKIVQDLKNELNLMKSDEDVESAISSDGRCKILTESKFKALQSMKKDYLYKVFKKYQDDKSKSQSTCSNEQNEIPVIALQDKTLYQSDFASDIVNKEQNAAEGKDFTEEYESVPKLLDKQKCESTVQSVGKQTCKDESASVSFKFNKPTRGLMTLFQEVSDISSSDDIELSSRNDEVIQNSSLEDSDSCSKDSSDVRSSSSSHSGDFDSCSSSSSDSSCSSSSESSCSSSSSESSCSSSSSESDCSSCSSELSTYSDTAKYRHARKQKKFLPSRHHERPTRSNWQQFPRPPNNLRKHHYQADGRQGYSHQSLVYEEIPTNRECRRSNLRPHHYQPVCRRCCSLQSPVYEEIPTSREYQRYTTLNTHKTKNHRHRSKSSNGHVCSGSCFLPSQHRYYPGHPCGYGQACFQWYQMFCNQWQELQNVANFFQRNFTPRY